MSLGDSLIRLFGADPAVFRPVYRVQTLILQRRARVIRSQRRGFWSNVSPFALLCFFAGLYGLIFLALILASKAPLLGAGLALTLGLCFLFLIVATDNFDVAGLRGRLLEPEETRPRALTRRRAAYSGGSERSRLFALLRIQLRSDWRTRSEFVLMPMMGIFFILFYTRTGSDRLAAGFTTFFYVWLLIVSTDVLTRSARPQTLWCLLTAPIDRARLSLETIGLVRLFQLLPLLAAAAAIQLWQAGVSPRSFAIVLQLLAAGDLVVILGKALFPEFPFSQPRIEGAMGGSRLVLMLLGGLVSGVATGVLSVSRLFGIQGILAATAVLVLLRFPAWRIARRRAAAAVAHLELAAAATA